MFWNVVHLSIYPKMRFVYGTVNKSPYTTDQFFFYFFNVNKTLKCFYETERWQIIYLLRHCIPRSVPFGWVLNAYATYAFHDIILIAYLAFPFMKLVSHFLTAIGVFSGVSAVQCNQNCNIDVASWASEYHQTHERANTPNGPDQITKNRVRRGHQIN